jgi:hypothetical protein
MISKRPSFPSTPFSLMLWRIYRTHTFGKSVKNRDLKAVQQVFESGAILALKLMAVKIEHGDTKDVIRDLKRAGSDLKVWQAELEKQLRLH